MKPIVKPIPKKPKPKPKEKEQSLLSRKRKVVIPNLWM